MVIGVLLVAFLKWKNITKLQFQFMQFWLSLSTGLGLLWFTYTEIINVYTVALQEGTDPGIWPQVITILSGLIPMVLGFFLWNSASKESSNKRFWLKILGALTLLVGGWILAGEIPAEHRAPQRGVSAPEGRLGVASLLGAPDRAHAGAGDAADGRSARAGRAPGVRPADAPAAGPRGQGDSGRGQGAAAASAASGAGAAQQLNQQEAPRRGALPRRRGVSPGGPAPDSAPVL